MKIHPEVVKAYKKTQDADDKHAEYSTTITKRNATRAANHLSKKIKQHHGDLNMSDKIKLRTKLQNMKESNDWVCGVCNNEPCTCESIVEATAPRWKRAGPNGEIEITIKGTKYKIEKALDHNERHSGEFKIMVWDARRREWVWDNTVRGKAYAKELVMDKLDENGIRKAQEDMGGTTTASVVGAGDNPTGTVVIDKRRRKDKMPRVLKRFRKYLDSDA